MTETSPILLWFRRDLRLAEHPALSAAVATGRPVIPVLVLDEVVEGYGAAPKFRLGAGIGAFQRALDGAGSKLVLRRGQSVEVLRALIAETGARSVWWTRTYDPDAIARDTAVKSALKAQEIDAQSFPGHLLFEPWTVATKTGGYYRVYTPMWKSVRDADLAEPEPAASRIPAPDVWPASDILENWKLDAQMHRGASVVWPHMRVGEAAARARLDEFVERWLPHYDGNRDLPAVPGTSGLSQNLALGEIGPRTCWHAGHLALQAGKAGAETFLKELVWREFA
ncbi:MAG: deoxyribodipyrimidine photo-lyase, partial [Pseudomonadota bacterium]